MLLANKTAIIDGARGAIGGAVARAFAREGASLFDGSQPAGVSAVAKAIKDAGGTVEAAHVDALDEQAVEKHADAVVKKTDGIDANPLRKHDPELLGAVAGVTGAKGTTICWKCRQLPDCWF
jgi:NAD(P)-dependent dehydrogenase (short-subunit alcohol dehydrogenase family)